ncbi:hypothetical protein E2C01_053331 [Portunus trituberculatus]|uniref:Uncharacterized protein n=1 Tax=Portunus trituberculatus TaxID=210409 RepID=A0A5B7GRR8_PORTR|nr:hypothetical protein [Portunus trituberculatus]
MTGRRPWKRGKKESKRGTKAAVKRAGSKGREERTHRRQGTALIDTSELPPAVAAPSREDIPYEGEPRREVPPTSEKRQV